MSVERVFQWKCDFCGSVAQKKDYGFPPGWGFTKEKILRHGCSICTKAKSNPTFWESPNRKLKI